MTEAKANKSSKKKARIGHANSVPRVASPGDVTEEVPRGWIQPNGKFIETTEHWRAIAKRLGEKNAATGEVCAHKAYALGWISLGHGGAFNAIGHENTFAASQNPAVITLRKLVAKVPHFSLRVEKQMGEFDASTGKHADFDVSEYDLMLFIRRGRLRKTT